MINFSRFVKSMGSAASMSAIAREARFPLEFAESAQKRWRDV